MRSPPAGATWPSTLVAGGVPVLLGWRRGRGRSADRLRARSDRDRSGRSAPACDPGLLPARLARRRGAATTRGAGAGPDGRDRHALPGQRSAGARRLSDVELVPRHRGRGVPRGGSARAPGPDARDPFLGPDLDRWLGSGSGGSGGVEPAGSRDGRTVVGDHRDGRQGHAVGAARGQRVGRADRRRNAGHCVTGRRPVHPRGHAADSRRRGPAGGPRPIRPSIT